MNQKTEDIDAILESVREEYRHKELLRVLEAGKPKFPWPNVIPALIGTTIGLLLILWGSGII